MKNNQEVMRTLTRKVHKVYEDNFGILKTFYAREDYEKALEEYYQATGDAKMFIEENLKIMCEAKDLNFDLLLTDENYLNAVPSREQLKEELLEAFYLLYKNTPNTTDFMERTVRKLAPQYNNDSCRLAILKKFVEGTYFVNGQFEFKQFNMNSLIPYVLKDCSKQEKSTYESMSDAGKKDFILSRLTEDVFKSSKVELSKEDVKNLIVLSIKRYKKEFKDNFTDIELSEETLQDLYQHLKENHLYVENESLSDSILKVNSDELINKIEKEFKKQLKFIKRSDQNGNESDLLVLYKQKTRDYVRALRRNAASNNESIDQNLLKICDDLAQGNFRVNGKTKTYLYYFAFMFGMKVYSSSDDEGYDVNLDMNKNLFEDYYNDNLVRFLRGDYADKNKKTTVENEPTGEGINYKNYVEVIYLYFLYNNPFSLMPSQRIDKAESTITKCVNIAKKTKVEDTSIDKFLEKNTQEYKHDFFKDVLNKDVQSLLKYLCANYVLTSDKDTRILVNSIQNKANQILEQLTLDSNELFVEDESEIKLDWSIKTILEKKYEKDSDFIKVLDLLDCRVDFAELLFSVINQERMLYILHYLYLNREKDNITIQSIKDNLIGGKLKSKPAFNCEGDTIRLSLECLSEVGFDIQKEENKNKVAVYSLGDSKYEDKDLLAIYTKLNTKYYLPDEDDCQILVHLAIQKKKLTRYEFIMPHLHYFIRHIDDVIDDIIDFPDMLESFKEKVNNDLVEARYQPISEKNIFDMYIILFLYFYLVENNGYIENL